ncbi:MAG: SMP-30/gluconolactonase/LRE family protein [Bryobacteraceae bacterium]
MRGGTIRFVLAFAAAFQLMAAGKITTGPPKLLVETGAREGPSWDPASSALYYVGGNRVMRRTMDGKVEVFRDNAPGANGSLVDPQGRVLVCEAGGRRVTRMEKDGSLTILADNYEGKKLNSPNDLSMDSKGRVYFTDPRYGRMDDMEMKDEAGTPIEAVYRIDAPGKIARLTTHEVERPNGIFVSAGDRYLYIADNYNNRIGGARKIYRFDLKPDGAIVPDSRKTIFDWKNGRGPDGFRMDQKGRFYVAAGLNKASEFETTDEFKGGIYILSREGKLIEFVPFPKDETTNCAFGGPDLKTLFATAGGQLWSVPVSAPGLKR